MKPPSRPDKPNVCTTAPSALSPRARGPSPTRTPSGVASPSTDAKALARHTDASLGAAESRPPDRRARSACVALSMPLGTRALQDRPGRAFKRSTNSEDNAGAFKREVRDSLAVVEDRAPATKKPPARRSPATTHRNPKAATAHATACVGVNLAMRLLGASPVSSPERVARRGAPSVDAPGGDEVFIASLACLVPSTHRTRVGDLHATPRESAALQLSRAAGSPDDTRAVSRGVALPVSARSAGRFAAFQGESGSNTSTRRRFRSVPNART